MRLVRSLVLSAVAGSASLAFGPDAARAADEGSGVDCVSVGKGVIEKGVSIWSERASGIAVAGFTTQPVDVEVWDFPADAAGRARIKTGRAGGSLRIEGFVDAAKVPLSAKNDLVVVSDHIWIARGQPLKLKGASPGKIQVESTFGPLDQKLKSKTSCSSVAIGRVAADEPELPQSAKKFVLKSSSLDLYDAAGGSTIFTLDVATPETGILLFSTEPSGAYTHVRHLGGAVIDAWAKTSDLKPFPKGEMLDSLAGPGAITVSPAKLKVEGATKEVVAPKDVPLRLSASDSAKVIGVIEDGATVIVIDTMAGWSRVFPKWLEIIPPDGKDFWAKASDLGVK